MTELHNDYVFFLHRTKAYFPLGKNIIVFRFQISYTCLMVTVCYNTKCLNFSPFLSDSLSFSYLNQMLLYATMRCSITGHITLDYFLVTSLLFHNSFISNSSLLFVVSTSQIQKTFSLYFRHCLPIL